MITTENNIFDYLARNSFALDNALQFATQNDISVTDDLSSIEYDVSNFVTDDYVLKYKPVETVVESDIVVLEHQSNFDLAIQMTGSIEGVLQLLCEQSITDLKSVGTKLSPLVSTDTKVFKYYLKNNIHPATWYEKDAEPEGIGVMIIEDTFTIE